MHKIRLSTKERNTMINITSDVQKAILEMKILDGIVTVFCPHTTAGITISESADPDVRSDILKKLEELIPPYDGYQHSEGNSDAHIKASLVGNAVQVILEKGDLQLGSWQAIYFCEFDGPRNREVWVKNI